MDSIKTIRGIKDIVFPESGRWKKIINKVENLLESYGYKRIFIPVIEYTGLFTRSIGEDTDIVSKEMYSFKDKKGRNLSLRPEGTAGVVRAMIDKNLLMGKIREKTYYFGPMFRYEKPQEGRYRQFYQIGCEVFGEASPEQDAEITELALLVTVQCGCGKYKLNINSVGCETCRAEYKKSLKIHLKNEKDKLCEDCVRRLDKNTLRILDCKKTTCKQVYKILPEFSDYLCDNCGEYIKAYERCLDNRGIEYRRDNLLVRGLDYYTGPVFELEVSKEIVVAGGRYGSLVKELGGPDVSACGWALGLERLAAASSIEEVNIPHVYIALLDGGHRYICRHIADALRKYSISVEEDYEDIAPGMKLRLADRKKIRWVIIEGEKEAEEKKVTIKNMKSGEQIMVAADNIQEIVRIVKC
ncbi:histidine--tRNA ligase [Elusimicrobiota bacterium]